MTDPRIARLVAAVQAYRESGERAELELLQQHGERAVAHALTMERVLAPEKREKYTADVEAWLKQQPS